MVKRIGGQRRKTRSKLSKNIRDKSKISLSRYFQTFNDGEKVVLKAEPAVQKGMYFPRFHGSVGMINGKQGRCYIVKINDRKKEKSLLVHPIHLRRLQ